MSLTPQQTAELHGLVARRRERLIAEIREDVCANPGAVRCIDCQRVHEKTYAGSGRTSL